MSLDNIRKITLDGEIIHPATTTDAVIHPMIKDSLTKLIYEYNISDLFPQSGVDGTNIYTLSLAISVLSDHLGDDRKVAGVEIGFLSYAEEDKNKYIKYTYSGQGEFLNTDSWSLSGSSDGGGSGGGGDIDINLLREKFLNKDRQDVTAYLLQLKGGVEIGSENFISGIDGKGSMINTLGEAEFRKLTVWDSFRVPEFTFNSVKIFLGIDWQVPGAGTIESVTPDEGATTGTATLKLEKGQLGAIGVDDIALGIWHMGDDNDSDSDSDDGEGNFTFSGFTSIYFRITEVNPDKKTFKYSLRPGTTVHPRAGMNFACYGNFTDPQRQTSSYRTRTYSRRLRLQNKWEITKENVAMQDGDLSNLEVFGLNMTGYSLYVNSVYFTGVIKQLKPDGTPVMTANDRGAYVPGTRYDYYDRVSHEGSLWLCVNEAGTETEPSKENPDWLLQVSKGEDGQDGEDGQSSSKSIVIDVDNQNIIIAANKEGNIAVGLPATVTFTAYYGMDETPIKSITVLPIEDVVTSVSENILTISEYTSQDDKKQLTANVTVEIEGKDYVRAIGIGITKIRPGEDGSVPDIYELSPNNNVIKVGKDGTYNPQQILCKVRKISQSGVTIIDSLPLNYTLKYKIDQQGEMDWNINTPLETTSISEYLNIYLYSPDKVLLDSETIPVVKDGTDGGDGKPGESSLIVDVDNQNVVLSADSNGDIVFGLPSIINVSAYYGVTPVDISRIELGSSSELEASVDGSTITLSGYTSSNDTSVLTATVKANIPEKGEQSRDIAINVSRIRPGQDGKIPEIYEIIPSSNIIQVSSGSYIPTTISASIKKVSEKGVEIIKEIPEGYKSKYSIDGGEEVDWDLSDIQTSSIKKNILLKLLKESEEVIDFELVPVVKDGADGEDGTSGESSLIVDVDNQNIFLSSRQDGWITSGLPATITVSAFYGISPVTISKIELGELEEGIEARAQDNTITLSGYTSSKDTSTITATVSANIPGKGEQSREIKIGITKLKPGADGKIPDIYEIYPSTNIIQLNKLGTYFPESVIGHVKKTSGTGEVEILGDIPEGYTCSYKIDDGEETPWDLKTEIQSRSITSGLTVNLLKDGKAIDSEYIPLVKDGTDGEPGKPGASGDSLAIDIDNQNIVLSANSTGEVVLGLPATVTFTAYLGTDKTSIKDIVLTPPEGVVASKSDNVVTITGFTSENSVETIPVVVKVDVPGKGELSRDFKIGISKLKPGADGKIPDIYEILPSINVIKVNSSGTYEEETINCSLKKISSDGVTIINTLPDPDYQYTFKYVVDGGAENDWNFSPIRTDTIKKGVEFKLKKIGSLIDSEIVPVVKDGTNAENPIVIDVDNQNIVLSANSTGEVVLGLPAVSTFHAYLGTEEVPITKITPTPNENVELSVEGSKITITRYSSREDKENIEVSVEVSGVTRKCIISIIRVKSGADGVVPDIYEIFPGNNVIKIEKDGTYNPENFTCSVRKITKSGYSLITDLPGGLTGGMVLKFSYDDGEESKWSSSLLFHTKTVKKWMRFKLYDSGGKVIDEEFIPVLVDGTDGTDGTNGEDGETGKPGLTPIIYSLIPSTNSVTFTAEGKVSPNNISCLIKRIVGDTATSTRAIPFGYNVKYKIDNSSEVEYNDTYGNVGHMINIGSARESILFNLYKEKIVLNSDIDNLILGTEGDDGAIVKGLPGSFTLTAFKGSSPKSIDRVEVSHSKYLKTSISGSTVTLEEYNTTKRQEAIFATAYFIEEGVTKSEEITILVTKENKLKSYRLVPSAKTITDGVDNVSVNIKLWDEDPSPSGKSVTYEIDDCGVEHNTSENSEISTENISSIIVFRLYDMESESKNLIDIVRIPVVKDINTNILVESARVSVVKDGETGKPGSSPRYRGFWSAEKQYTYDDENRDIVLYGTSKYRVKNRGQVPIGTAPDTVEYWEEASEFEFIAMDTALIDNANIAGFIFRKLGETNGTPYGELKSQTSDSEGNPNLSMNTNTGKLICKDAEIKGKIEASSGSFNGEVNAETGSIGGFKIGKYLLGSKEGTGDGYGVSMSNSGFIHSSENCDARLGNAFSAATGYYGTCAAYLETRLTRYSIQDNGSSGTLVVKTTNSESSLYGQCAVRITTDCGDKDVAIDFKGKINCHAKDIKGSPWNNYGFTGGVGFERIWNASAGDFREGNLLFYNGIMVGIEWK